MSAVASARSCAALAGRRPVAASRRLAVGAAGHCCSSSSLRSPVQDHRSSDWLGDTDDAVRLVTVRELIAGAPWFDTTLPRIGAPDPLVSHWSRLIDLPLAASIGALSPLLGPERAELATRIAWPSLLFFVLALIVAREAQRRAGRWAAAFALVLVATSAIALAQFRPGPHRPPQRADPVRRRGPHVSGAQRGRCARRLDRRRACWAWGSRSATRRSLSSCRRWDYAALAAIFGPRSVGAGVTRAAASAAIVLLLALIATVPPARWLAVHCDALALNLVVLAAAGAAGLWAALAAPGRPAVRLAILGAAAAGGGALYAGLEPACLAGPFGQVGQALRPIWLDEVTETKSVLWLAAGHPGPAVAAMIFVLAGAAAQLELWRRRRDTSTGLAATFVLLAAALGFWQIKLLPYASWLAALPIAVWAAGLRGTASISAPVARIAAVVLLSQASLDAGLSALLSPMQRSSVHAVARDVESSDPRRPCFLSHNVRLLDGLPSGLVAADIDLGPYIVAHSPHRVVAAPYHRLEAGILADHAILNGPPADARARLQALGVAYVALCADRWHKSAGPGLKSKPLRDRLLDGEPIDFLQELTLPAGSAIKVWRVSLR